MFGLQRLFAAAGLPSEAVARRFAGYLQTRKTPRHFARPESVTYCSVIRSGAAIKAGGKVSIGNGIEALPLSPR